MKGRPKKANMKANEAPEGQNKKEMKAQRGQNTVSLGVAYLDPISKMAHKMFKIT